MAGSDTTSSVPYNKGLVLESVDLQISAFTCVAAQVCRRCRLPPAEPTTNHQDTWQAYGFATSLYLKNAKTENGSKNVAAIQQSPHSSAALTKITVTATVTACVMRGCT